MSFAYNPLVSDVTIQLTAANYSNSMPDDKTMFIVYLAGVVI
jgi:hypothetical protein